MTEFFAMGGYGAYVWSSYALAFIVLVINWVVARRRHNQLVQQLRVRLRSDQ